MRTICVKFVLDRWLKEMLFKDISIFMYGGHFVQGNETI